MLDQHGPQAPLRGHLAHALHELLLGDHPEADQERPQPLLGHVRHRRQELAAAVVQDLPRLARQHGERAVPLAQVDEVEDVGQCARRVDLSAQGDPLGPGGSLVGPVEHEQLPDLRECPPAAGQAAELLPSGGHLSRARRVDVEHGIVTLVAHYPKSYTMRPRRWNPCFGVSRRISTWPISSAAAVSSRSAVATAPVRTTWPNAGRRRSWGWTGHPARSRRPGESTAWPT